LKYNYFFFRLGLARSLLIPGPVSSREACPVFSVTSEAAANAAFQAAPQWSTRSDQPPANDVFGGLVHQNTTADTTTAPPPPRPQRRTDGAPPPADNAGPANAPSSPAASNDSNSNGNAGPPSDNNANNATNTGGPTGPGAAQPSQTKSTGAPKADPAKSTDKSANGDTSAADLTVLAQQAALTAATPNPVAVVIPVTTAATNVPAATTSGNSTAPLAIAAAAIAASAQAVSAQAASSTQTKTDSNTAATDAAATATAATAGTATAKTASTVAPSGADAKPAPVIPQAAQANATPANAAALTSAVAATAPVTAKAPQGKSPAATAATDGSTTSGTADPSATNAPGAAQNGLLQQTPATGKPGAANPAADAASADVAASSTLAATVSAHEHAPAATSEHASTDAPDPSAQVIGTTQPQLNSPAAAAAPGGALTVTAQGNGPVPLSGLALEIAASAKSGKSRFEIRLDPADLGRIDVRIDIDRNGQVTSHLTVEKPETLSMLRQDAPQLQRALDDAGLKTGTGGLQFSLRDQSSSGQNSGNDSSPNAQRLVIGDEDTIPAAVAGRTYGRALGSSSGVDIRV
jgi:flagellar hook-length control protein FliK